MARSAPLRSAAEFFAHALAIEREAAERYAEFSRYMDDHDRQDLAELFRRLARLERDHARFIEKRAGPIPSAMPADGEYHWLESGPPDAKVHEWLFRLITPRDVLKIALEAERRAEAFFAGLAEESSEPDVRRLALEFSAEEREHAERIERVLAAEPDPCVDWESVYAPRPGGEGT